LWSPSDLSPPSGFEPPPPPPGTPFSAWSAANANGAGPAMGSPAHIAEPTSVPPVSSGPPAHSGPTGLIDPPPLDRRVERASVAPPEPVPSGERQPLPFPPVDPGYHSESPTTGFARVADPLEVRPPVGPPPMPPPSVSPMSAAPVPGPPPGAPASVPAAPKAVPVPAAPDWTEIEIPVDDDDEIAPWDRRPLMIVIVAGVILVLIAVVTAIATSAYFNPGKTRATWHPAGTSPSGTPSRSAGAAPVPPSNTITLSGVGDVIMGTQPNHLPPKGGAGMFDPVKSALASDLVMGNLETPLTADTGSHKCGMVTPTPGPGNPNPTPIPDPECFQFFLPPTYANHLRDAGFQVMNLANNHTNDMGSTGLANTRSALQAAGVQHTGAPGQITYVTVKGVKVAVLGFSVYSWGANLNNLSSATALVKQAAQNADLVVVQMQAGAEGADKSHVKPGHEIFFGEDRGDEIGFSHAVIDAGADVVFGHGPHIMRGMEFYKGRLIAYSLGNFCGYGVLSSNGYLGVGGVLRVTLQKDGTWVKGNLVPTEMVKGGLPAPDSDKRALAFVDGLSSSDFGASAAHISRTDGAITPPTP
jgi:hypothetical protein